jgi:acylphosphatase
VTDEEPTLKVRAHMFVSGFVQGVLFRYETRRRAAVRGVTGWVRNLRDGRVEAVFEGEKEAVEEMVEFCRRGPPSATVRNFEVRWEKPTEEYERFSVLY